MTLCSLAATRTYIPTSDPTTRAESRGIAVSREPPRLLPRGTAVARTSTQKDVLLSFSFLFFFLSPLLFFPFHRHFQNRGPSLDFQNHRCSFREHASSAFPSFSRFSFYSPSFFSRSESKDNEGKSEWQCRLVREAAVYPCPAKRFGAKRVNTCRGSVRARWLFGRGKGMAEIWSGSAAGLTPAP